MSLFEIAAVLLTAAAVGSYVNHKWIKLPLTIGLMLLAMAAGLVGLLLQNIGWIGHAGIEKFLQNIDFSEVVFHGMLSFLLFSGALHINIEDLKSAKLPIAVTATVSTFLSTFLIGSAFYFLANALSVTHISWLYALLFGAILSPTDPIAVLAIIKKMGAPKSIETKIAGESLFNDGVAIVIFLTLLGLIMAGAEPKISSTLLLLLQQAGGGLLAGAALGWLACQMLRRTDAHHVQLLITLAVVSGGYLFAEKLHVSAPLAMVVAGIMIGNQGRTNAISDKAREQLGFFWELIDEILNAVLFLLIGLEMMVIKIEGSLALLAPVCILAALASRYISVAIPLQLMKPWYAFTKGTSAVMTWGGLRGALSIAMVLTLQEQHIKELFLPCVYAVVVFSIAVQGLTFGRLLKKYNMT
ncbi:MAG: sodium:proton antiporter [Alphaproteobacteria bacterium]|nr:sodium:proton antiporter [Alphaproteobacteria bacterium]